MKYALRQRQYRTIIVGMLLGSASLFLIGSDERNLPEMAPQSEKSEKHFIADTRGEAVDNEGTRLGFRTFGTDEAKLSVTSFKTPGGTKVSALHGTFRSSEEATRYFDRTVGASAKLVQQGQKLNKKGRPIGWRAEVTLLPQGSASQSWAVVWTDGKDYWEILSATLADAAELEKRYAN